MTTTTIDLNDPGPDLANQRADEVESAAMVPIEIADGGRVRIGTASWTDPTMTAAGVFYPAAADDRRGAAPVLRLDLPARRGRRDLLRAAVGQDGRAVGRADARRTSRSTSRPTP